MPQTCVGRRDRALRNFLCFPLFGTTTEPHRLKIEFKKASFQRVKRLGLARSSPYRGLRTSAPGAPDLHRSPPEHRAGTAARSPVGASATLRFRPPGRPTSFAPPSRHLRSPLETKALRSAPRSIGRDIQHDSISSLAWPPHGPFKQGGEGCRNFACSGRNRLKGPPFTVSPIKLNGAGLTDVGYWVSNFCATVKALPLRPFRSGLFVRLAWSRWRSAGRARTGPAAALSVGSLEAPQGPGASRLAVVHHAALNAMLHWLERWTLSVLLSGDFGARPQLFQAL